MERTFRCALLVGAIAVTTWLTVPQTGEALQSCSSLSRTCTVGSTTTCIEGEDTRSCECVNVNGNGRWLCFY